MNTSSTGNPPDPTDPRHRRRLRVVVIGGGFGGLAAVRGLRRADVEITLIDRHAYSTFSPLLYQVAAAGLNPGDITWFLRAIRAHQSNVRFLRGTVTSLDTTGRRIHLDDGRDVEYDRLIIAVGVTANFFGIPGAERYAMPLYRRSQALAVRDRMFTRLEAVAASGQDRDLRIVIVGGGATGVETAGALAELRNHDMPSTYPELDAARVHITLVERQPHVLDPFHPRLRDYARTSLERRGVDLRLDSAVREVRADGVVVERDGHREYLSAGIVVWASGVAAHAVVETWSLPQGRGGRIATDEHLRVVGLPDVYAIGDVAAIPGRPLPQVVQPAVQGGRHVARVLAREVRGGSMPRPFRYRDKGSMATIGRSSAVAEIRFLPRMTGLPAWIAWTLLHVYMLLGNRNRFATFTNLTARYLGRGSHNVIVGETPAVARRPVATRVSAAVRE